MDGATGDIDTRLTRSLRLDRWLIETIVFVVLALIAASAAWQWNSANTEQRGFPAALEYGPGPAPSNGYRLLTAARLETKQPWRADLGRVRYVSAHALSSGPTVVSVRVISSGTWAAVSLGANNRCYALLVTGYGPNYEYGSTYYARFAKGTPCRAAIASRANVRSTVRPS